MEKEDFKMKQPKHSTRFLFGGSPKADTEARKHMPLCAGCLGELTHRIDEVYKFRYLLQKSQKKLEKQKRQLKLFNERWKELRKAIASKGMPDIGKETNLVEHFKRYRAIND